MFVLIYGYLFTLFCFAGTLSLARHTDEEVILSYCPHFALLFIFYVVLFILLGLCQVSNIVVVCLRGPVTEPIACLGQRRTILFSL